MFRVPTAEAKNVELRLSRAGVASVRVDDADLALSMPPTRLKSLEFRTDSLQFFLFNSDDAGSNRPQIVVT